MNTLQVCELFNVGNIDIGHNFIQKNARANKDQAERKYGVTSSSMMVISLIARSNDDVIACHLLTNADNKPWLIKLY